MTNDQANPKPECPNAPSCVVAGFVDIVIRHSGLRITVHGKIAPTFFSAHWDHEPIRFGPRAVPARSGHARARVSVKLRGAGAGHMLRPGTGRGPPRRPSQLTGHGSSVA